MKHHQKSFVCLLLVLLSTRGFCDEKFVEPKVERLTKTYQSKFFLRYSPDGTHIVYSRQDANRRAANRVLVGTRIIKADGSDDRALLPEYDAQVQVQEHPSFSPDGKRLVLSGGGNDTGNSAKDTFVCDIGQDFLATNLRKLVAGASVNVGEEPVYSLDGKRIAFTTVDEQLWTIDADGQNKKSVIQVGGQYCHQPAWSPDGERLTFASDRDGNIELYTIRPEGTEITRLTDEPGIDCRPRYSPDGRWILFTSNRAGNFDLFVLNVNDGRVRQLTSHPAPDDHADWSPDGKSIAFVSLRDGGFDIYRLTLPPEIAITRAAELTP